MKMQSRRTNKEQKQQGFTLIELIIVIVIIAILAAVAIPKYLDLQIEAHRGAAAGIAGALAGASSTNYALRSAGLSAGIAIASCDALTALLQGGVPTGYTVDGTIPACSVNHTASGASATFVGHAVS